VHYVKWLIHRIGRGPGPHQPPKARAKALALPLPNFLEPMKPLCPDCGDRHESYQAHVWRVSKPVANTKPVANAVANKKRKPGKYRDPEARKAYMRELMRKRRAGG
jgi:tRNA(Ile2) C34 agmatinyltransferase TiaS